MANLFFLPYRPAYDNVGGFVVPGAQVYFTNTGGTPKPIYSNSGLTIARSNPVVADGVGKLPTGIYMDPAITYRVRIYARDAIVGVDTPIQDFNPYVPGVFADAAALQPVADAAAASATAASNSASGAATSAASASASATAAALSATSANTAEAAIIAALADSGSVSLADLEASGLGLRPEWFGAVGDGVTNDTAAFIALNAAIAAAGGGIVELKKGATYLVGAQTGLTPRAGYTFPPDLQYIINFANCRYAVVRGNGAKIKAANGLKYGTFNADGTILTTAAHGMPYFGSTIAAPYDAMLHADNCEFVDFRDVELDGNVGSMSIGGQWGDTTWQLPGSGWLITNCKRKRVSNVYSHHHPLDGQMHWDTASGTPQADEMQPLVMVNCEALYNGRQAHSWVGGRGVIALNCKFSYTGRNGVIQSMPGSGFDFEREQGPIRNGVFVNCEFIDNWQTALVNDSNDAGEISFYNCKMVGVIGWSLYLHPQATPTSEYYFRFHDCLFVGAATASGNADPANAPQFIGCTFTMNTALSPTGAVYGTFSDFAGGSTNILFDNCRLETGGNMAARLPSILPDSIIRNCSFKQDYNPVDNSNQSYPRGRFYGRNIMDGDVNTYGGVNYGTLIINGGQATTRFESTIVASQQIIIDGMTVWPGLIANEAIFFNEINSGAVIAGWGNIYDFVVLNKSGAAAFRVPTGTQNLQFLGSATATAGIVGYATGAGGVQTQATSKSTAVILNKLCGEITMNNASLAAGAIVSFTQNNSFAAAGMGVVRNHVSGGTIGAYTVEAVAGAGTITWYIRNNTGGALAEALVLRYELVGGATS